MKKVCGFTLFTIIGFIVFHNLFSGEGLNLNGSYRFMTDNERAPKSIGELFQVILNVQNMERQVEFYRDIMGFPVVYPEQIKDLSKEPFVRLSTGGAALVMHSGRRIKVGKQEPRISFMTEDVHAARAALIERGVTLGEVRQPAPGVLVVDGRDPEGNAFHIESRVAQ